MDYTYTLMHEFLEMGKARKFQFMSPFPVEGSDSVNFFLLYLFLRGFVIFVTIREYEYK